MKMGRPIRHRTARAAQMMVGPRSGAPYTPPPTLPPRPEWLKLDAAVVLPDGSRATVYEIRPSEDGATWEIGCVSSYRFVGRHRLSDVKRAAVP